MQKIYIGDWSEKGLVKQSDGSIEYFNFTLSFFKLSIQANVPAKVIILPYDAAAKIIFLTMKGFLHPWK